MELVRSAIAYLIYDRKWTWLEKAINSICEFEMALDRGFEDDIVYMQGCPGYHNTFSVSCVTKCATGCKGLENIEKIPQGMYCYDSLSTCPFWSYSDVANVLYGEQSCGYCHLMRKGDFNSDTMILWDQCKCCGINEKDED